MWSVEGTAAVNVLCGLCGQLTACCQCSVWSVEGTAAVNVLCGQLKVQLLSMFCVVS